MDSPEVSKRFHKKPHFSSAPRDSATVGQQSHHHHLQYQYPKQQKQKMSQSFSNNTNSLNTTVNVSKTTITNNLTLADDRNNILDWLSPLVPKLRHQGIQARRVENVGEWLLQTKEFGSWRTGCGGAKSDNAVLFCYGDPGVGKTYIR